MAQKQLFSNYRGIASRRGGSISHLARKQQLPYSYWVVTHNKAAGVHEIRGMARPQTNSLGLKSPSQSHFFHRLMIIAWRKVLPGKQMFSYIVQIQADDRMVLCLEIKKTPHLDILSLSLSRTAQEKAEDCPSRELKNSTSSTKTSLTNASVSRCFYLFSSPPIRLLTPCICKARRWRLWITQQRLPGWEQVLGRMGFHLQRYT